MNCFYYGPQSIRDIPTVTYGNAGLFGKVDFELIAITANLSYEETRTKEVYTTGIFTFGFSDGIITKELGRCPGKEKIAMFNFTILSKYLVSRPFTYELDQVLVCSNKVKENRFLLSD